MIINSTKDFKPYKKYKIYGEDMNNILTYKQMQKIWTEEEIETLIKSGKVAEFQEYNPKSVGKGCKI